VLIIGPANYPLMLPGIQIVQALVAGNTVLFKPAPGHGEIARLLAESLYETGVPTSALAVLEDTTEAAQSALGNVDKVVLTGSAQTGRAVLGQLASHLTPSVMELSGCDAVYVMRQADLDLAAKCVAFGLNFNGSATCMAPRRLFVHREMGEDFARRLAMAIASAPPTPIAENIAARVNEIATEAIIGGAKLVAGKLPIGQATTPLLFDHVSPDMRLAHEDMMTPVASIIRVDSDDDALEIASKCGYRLSASIFGPLAEARRLAGLVDAGCVIINDMIAPSADPRLPFGGRGESGFGVTRGAEGLLEMTQIKTVIARHSGPMPYLEPSNDQTTALLRAFLRLSHADGPMKWVRAVIGLIGAGRAASKKARDG
jgi:acyl-CoA reductase-like NAD-dependent aldehyde dehydrogenase